VALTPKQQRFVEEYLVDLNATQAAIRAGYKEKSARSIGQENLTKPDISAAIVAKRKELSQQVNITTERVLLEYGRIAFFDPRRLFDRTGRPLPITELDDDTAAAIAGLDVLEEYDGTGSDRKLTGLVKKWKIANKLGALDKLGEHLGLFGKKSEDDEDEDGKPVRFAVVNYREQAIDGAEGAGIRPLSEHAPGGDESPGQC
jgi:phage terminase small subunit